MAAFLFCFPRKMSSSCAIFLRQIHCDVSIDTHYTLLTYISYKNETFRAHIDVIFEREPAFLMEFCTIKQAKYV